MVEDPGQQFHRLASGPTEQGVVYDEDVNSLFIGERNDTAANDLGTKKTAKTCASYSGSRLETGRQRLFERGLCRY
ncbi:MAG: hypothetical protein ACOYCB_10120 [Fastidiosipilaceae bacterium]